MQTIRLEREEWSFDESDRLGPPGGFGEVFRGSGAGGSVAIKRLKLSAGAASHREMSIGSAIAERSHEHVVPVFDYGQDAEGDRYYLVMPVCDYSLHDFIKRNGTLSPVQAKEAALHIVSGLTEVSDIVHRDMKPGNVLWHEGKWKIADFGIAKFVEDATSYETLRSSLTPPYAAPEQWRLERPTAATDIYALGCIFHAMLTGSPPFNGDPDDVREAHLHTPAPAISNIEPRLGGLIATMLRKAPTARPSLSRVAQVLSSLEACQRSPGRDALAAAGQVVSRAEAEAEASRQAAETAARERQAVADDGTVELRAIITRLFDAIEESAEATKRDRDSITLGWGYLQFGSGSSVGRGRTGRHVHDPYDHGWDIYSNAYLSLNNNAPQSSTNRPSIYVWRQLGVCKHA